MSKAILERLSNTYDETPYRSYPYPKSRPENLCTLGTLFGMNPPSIATAKVLELGCSEGGNLIPHAVSYPNSTFVGIDLSKVQIDTAKSHVAKLKLKNIAFINRSITDIDETLGTFDYIIAHGVISWVPDFVRDKIFSICSKHLRKNGIAYVSYNTLPGWNMVRSIRDMMIYHTKAVSDPQEKVTQARALLQFIINALEDPTTPYAHFLKKEARLTANHEDYYLRHEYLEEHNKQYYFTEFITEAEKQNLQYLSDCSLASMYLHNLSPKAVEQLKGLEEITHVEQYIDFINNRRFRSTLLIHEDVAIDRKLTSDAIRKFTLTLDVIPEKPLAAIDLGNEQESLQFFHNNKKKSCITSSAPSLKAVLYTFAEYVNSPLSFNDLVSKANDKLRVIDQKIVEEELLDDLMQFVLKGYIHLSLSPGHKDTMGVDKPKLAPYAYYQATQTSQHWVTNLMHQKVPVGRFDKVVMRYMDGSHTKDEIVSHLVQAIKADKTGLIKHHYNTSDIPSLQKKLATSLAQFIQKLADKALFI